MQKRILIEIFSLLISGLFLLSFSSGAVSVISPLNGTNHSSSNTVLFNVSFVNNTDILIFGTGQTQVNASFYTVRGSTRTFVANSSQCSSNACWTTFTISASNDFFGNITATIFNATAQVNASTNTTSIYFDSTRPAIFASNFTSPAIGTNYSGTLSLNISAVDATIGVHSVIFNITNSSGSQNTSVTATREGSSSNYFVSINTAHYPNGRYNLTAYVNDSLNNLNNSAIIYSIYFDNTAPSVSLSCSPSPVEQESTLSCLCSASDSTTNLISTSYTPNPSTANTGTYETSCSASDSAGNSASSTVQYTVYSEGSGSSGSSSGSSGPGLSPSSPSSSNSGSSEESNTEKTTVNQGSESPSSNSASSRGISEILSQGWVIGILIAIAVLVVIAIVIRKNNNK